MRQGQQNRRGRNRNHHHNRKGQNPLSRSYESNGPDVKIRGTAAHIAEKYISLARDASSSGDSVMAENYLQHAEHYNRIIMAYREQLQGPDGMNGNRVRSGSDDGFGDEGGSDEDGAEEGIDGGMPSRFASPRHGGEHMPRSDVPAEQPNVSPRPEDFGRMPPERMAERGPDGPPRFQHDREPRRDRERGDFPPRFREPREYRGENRDRDRGGEGRDRDRDRDRHQGPPPAPARAAVPDVPPPVGSQTGAPPQREAREGGSGRQEGGRRSPRYQPNLQDQPEFLRRPVRRSRRDTPEAGDNGDAGENGTPRGEGQDKTTA